MGTAGSFAVLAGSTVTNTGPSVLDGNLGVFAGTAIVGFPPGTVNSPFSIYAGDAVAGQAQSDLGTAYVGLANTARTQDLTGQDLGGKTLAPGVYNFDSSAQLTGALVLNAGGDPNGVFIFNIGSTLTTAAASNVSLIGGAQGQNVFFRVGSSATLGASTSFVGDILALTSITLGNGANVTCGAAMARNGAVTLDNNRISISTLAQCLAPLLPPVVPPGTVVPPDPSTPPVTEVPPGTVPPVVTPGTPVPPGTTPTPGVTPPGTVLTPVVTAPGTVPTQAVTVLPPGTVASPVAVVTQAINNGFYTAVLEAGGTVPADILRLSTLPPASRVYALTQLAGEPATAIVPSNIKAVTSFLRLVLDPFAGDPLGTDRFAAPQPPENPDVGNDDQIVLRVLGYAPTTSPSANQRFFDSRVASGAVRKLDPAQWNVWAAVYGERSNTDGGQLAHDRSVGSVGFATGLDYRITPTSVVGFALAGGGTDYDLPQGLGGGHSDLFQAAVYSFNRFDNAYISAAAAYAGNWGSTERELTAIGGDTLTSSFFANNFGARIESGYRLALPAFSEANPVGFTPYVAVQGQIFSMPSYAERSDLGSSTFALAYESKNTGTARTEIGAWLDQRIPLDNATLVMRARAAWAHDYFTEPTTVSARFQSLPGSDFTLTGALPTKNSALLSAGAWLQFENGLSIGAKVDGEFSNRSQSYAGTGVLRYAW
jgi:hypothetical protein